MDEARLRQFAVTWSGQGPLERARTEEELIRELPAKYRPLVEEYFRVLKGMNTTNPPPNLPPASQDITRAIDNIRREQIRDDERRREAQNAANPQGNVTSGTFGQITGIAGGTALTNASYVERQVRVGLRFTF